MLQVMSETTYAMEVAWGGLQNTITRFWILPILKRYQLNVLKVYDHFVFCIVIIRSAQLQTFYCRGKLFDLSPTVRPSTNNVNELQPTLQQSNQSFLTNNMYVVLRVNCWRREQQLNFFTTMIINRLIRWHIVYRLPCKEK